MGPIRGDPGAVRGVVLAWTLRWVLLVAIALAAIGVARPAEPAQEPAAATVRMTDAKRFEPALVRVKRGDTVRWRNASSLTHTVTDDGSKARMRSSWSLPQDATPFDSGTIAPGGTWSHRFTAPGTYRYFCQPHETDGMAALVDVSP